MADVRLTATNPEDSSVVPVACNEKGELLLEEPIQGPPGNDSDMMLPPDPYEGALLGWLNGGLAWIGTPPVPIPENMFGPIVSWDPQSGYLVVEGEVPDTVNNGVYVYQCDELGNYFTEGCDTSQVWTDIVSDSTPNQDPSYPITNAFNTDPAVCAMATGTNDLIFDFGNVFNRVVSKLRVSSNNGRNVRVDGDLKGTATGNNPKWIDCGEIAFSEIKVSNWSGGGGAIYNIEVDNKLLVDPVNSLSLRVNQLFQDGLLGVPNTNISFTPGKYLFVPSQRVAPWVLYGNDPTSRIDYLRQRRD